MWYNFAHPYTRLLLGGFVLYQCNPIISSHYSPFRIQYIYGLDAAHNRNVKPTTERCNENLGSDSFAKFKS